MSLSEREGLGTPRRRRLAVGATLGAAALVSLLVLIQVSSSHPSARAAAAETACNSYLTGVQPTTSSKPARDGATIADAYPTTAGNLATWLLHFDPLAESSAYRSIPRNEDVTACVIKGKWDLPNQVDLGPGIVNYEIVMIVPNGTSTPLMWGPSELAKQAPPAV